MKRYTWIGVNKKVIAFCTLTLIIAYSYGNTFVATTSGNWSSAATWGGTAPSFNISSDQIAITSGITVTLDSNLTINGDLASLSVLGTLISNDSTSLELGLGAITGTGVLNLGVLIFDSNSLLAFTGKIYAYQLTSSSTGIEVADSIAINNTLTLSGGIFALVSGGVLILPNGPLPYGGTIVMAGGSLLENGGTVNLSYSYNIIYRNVSATTGIETTSPHLNSVTIDVPDTSTVTLSANLTVQGTLTLQQGSLALNGYNLDIVGNIAGGGSGNIKSTPSSGITVSSTSPPAGGLSFAAGADTLSTLVVSVGGFAATVQINSNLYLDGGLQFISGSLDIGDNILTLLDTATISNPGIDSYIITGDSGALSMSLNAGQSFTEYPIGTFNHYDPAYAQLDSSSSSGFVQIGATNGVLAQGVSGIDLSLTQGMVDATWLVESNITSNLNLKLKLAWSASMEMNHFNRDSAYISHYTASHWDTSALQSAALINSQGPLFAIERDSITSLSPFAVWGTNDSIIDTTTAPSAVSPVTQDLEIGIYPNPASDNIVITDPDLHGKINMEIINYQGQVVATYVLANSSTSISLEDLESGMYLIRFFNDQSATVKRVVKL